MEKISACTVVYEGSQEEVNYQKGIINRVAAQYKGLHGGGENGMKGYFLTFLIAYLRDFASEYCYVAESFETSCPWSNVN